MNEHSLSRDELLVSLKDYAALLKARNNTLEELSQNSDEILVTLRNSSDPNIGRTLKRREQKCKKLALLCSNKDQDAVLIKAAKAVAHTSDEIGELARLIIALNEDSRTLGQEVLACQQECETLLRARLEATAQALRESKQRRKLVAAYGPTCNNVTPRFLDRQR